MNDGASFRQPFSDEGVSAVEAALTRTRSLLNMGRPAEALREATLALTNEPEHAGLLQLASAAQEALGQHREAMRLAERLLAVAPHYDVAHRMYAASRWNAGQRDRVAIQSAQRAVSLDPEDPDNRTVLAFMLTQRRRYAEAREQLDTALSLGGDTDSRAQVHALLGDLALHQRRPAEAETQAREALRLEPHSELGLRVMALAQLRSRQPHEAIRTALSAVHQQPGDETRVRYLRVIVDEYLPHPLSVRTWRFLFLPYGIGLGVSLVLALTLAIGNISRRASLPPDLREVVRISRASRSRAERWRPRLWLIFFIVFFGGMLLLSRDEATSPAFIWFFYLGALVGLALWIFLRRWR